jgi:hypothetical protein
MSFRVNLTSQTLLFLVNAWIARRNCNGIFVAVKGGRSPAQRTLDGIEKAFTLKGSIACWVASTSAGVAYWLTALSGNWRAGR